MITFLTQSKTEQIKRKNEHKRFDKKVEASVKNNKQLNDNDPMPFGIHKDKQMADVPAQYLDYISQQEWIKKYPAVLDYINKSRKVIDIELKRNN